MMQSPVGEILRGFIFVLSKKTVDIYRVYEFQDINRLQYEIVRMIAGERKNLTIVGDDDQSIYRFRGAKPEIMLGFERDYPGAKKVLLDINFRSTPEIVDTAGRLIRHNRRRFEKEIRASRPSGKPVNTVVCPDPAKITTPCESDCTCGVATCVKAAGLRKGNVALGKLDPDYFYSGNMKQGFQNLGFKVLTDSKYLTSDRYLLPGDILLLENHHAATNLDIGSMVRDEWKVDTVRYTVGWNRDDKGWWYALTDLTYAKSSWKKINGCWYYFNNEGYAVTGYQKIDGKGFYFCAEPGHPKECALMITDPEGALHVWGAK